MHHQLVRAGRPGVIAHAPEAILPPHPALVAGIDDQRVIVEPQPPEGVHDRADAIVHATGLGGDPADGRRVVEEFLVVEEPGMHRIAREAEERLVRIISRVAIAPGMLQQVAQPVGPVVGEIEEERPVLVPLDESHSALGPEVGQVGRLLPHRAVLDDRHVVELGRVPERHRDPVAEAFLRRQVGTEVPLAAEPADVTRLAAGSSASSRTRGSCNTPPVPSAHSAPRRRGSCARRAAKAGGPSGRSRARRRANRVAAQRPREPDAFGGEPVDVRRADVGVAVTAERPGSLVIGQDEDEIRPALGRVDRNGAQEDERQGKNRGGLSGHSSAQDRAH